MNRALAAAYAHGLAPGTRLALPATDVARLLVDVLTPSRWEPWNQYNDHRSYPSPRAAYLVDVEIVVANERWLFDPLRRATIAQPTDSRANGPLAPPHPPKPLAQPLPPIEWSRDAPRVGWGNAYVGMGQETVHAGVEQGDVQAGSGQRDVQAGVTHGNVHARARLDDVHAESGQKDVHAAATREKSPAGVGQRDVHAAVGQETVHVGSGQGDAHVRVGREQRRIGGEQAFVLGDGDGESAAGPRLDRTVRLEFARRPGRLLAGYGQFAEALTELEVGHVAGALVENAPRHGLRAYADGDGVTLEPGDVRAPGKMPKRSSGLGPRGLAADPRPLPIEALTAFIRSMEDLPDGTLTHPGLRHRLAVHNVVGVRDGWYTVDVRRADPAMDAVQDCHSHPQAVIDVSGMNLALVIAADVPAAVRAGEYQALLRAAGALGQHVCTAAAEAGMFCRPLRSFDDVALEAAAGFPLSHSLLYVLLAGRPKVTGPAYDLSPLEAP